MKALATDFLITFFDNEPGLTIVNSVVQVKPEKIPVMVINNTHKTIRLRRYCALGHVQPVNTNEICSISSTGNESYRSTSTSYPGMSKEEILSSLNAPADKHHVLLPTLLKHRHLFARNNLELTQTSTVEMSIPTGDHPPIRLRSYRTPLQNREIINKAVDEMLEAKIIEPSNSPWSFPIVLVDKKSDNSKRFCVDFRQLNKITKHNAYPLPVIDDILANLGKSKYFTSLDMLSGYWQIPLKEEDREKTAFTTGFRGLYHFLCTPFGLKNAPGVFQNLAHRVLQGLEKFAVAYLDDILIFSETLEEHISHVNIVLERFHNHNLKLKLSKCQFLKEQTSYLGFIIDGNGIRPDPAKVEAIRNLPRPQCIKDVRSVLGASGFYRRFCPSYSDSRASN